MGRLRHGELAVQSDAKLLSPGAQDGVLLKVTVAEHAGRLGVRALCAHLGGASQLRIRPVLTALADRRLGAATRRALQASRDRTRQAVGPTPRPAPR